MQKGAKITKLASTCFLRLSRACSSSLASSYFCRITCGGSGGAGAAVGLAGVGVVVLVGVVVAGVV